MDLIRNFFTNKHAADEKWKINGNLDTINVIRSLVTLLLAGGLITIYLTFKSGGTSIIWISATVVIFAALSIIHYRFEKLVNIRRQNEKLRELSIN
jgi:hypothetical protein